MNKNILKLQPYKQGFQPRILKNLKLNTNENPYNVDPVVLFNLLSEIKFFADILKFYPDPESKIIISQISNYYNVRLENIFVGNGSDEVLSNIFLTFFRTMKKLYIIDLTYSFYESFIKLYKINYELIRIESNFVINIKRFIKNNNNIIINNPNAPTGKSLSLLFLKVLLIKNKSVIVLDETYSDFENRSIIKDNTTTLNNLIIVKTFSKFFSLAGLRIGFSFAKKYITRKMNATKNCLNSYPVNIISQVSLKNIFVNNLYFLKIKLKLIKNKIFLINNLKFKDFFILKSYSNFILVTNKNININKLLNFLNKKDIYVRKFEIPKIENYLRISIGKNFDCITLSKLIRIFLKS